MEPLALLRELPRIVPRVLVIDMGSPFCYHDPMYVRSKTSKLSPRKTVQIVEAYVTPEGKRRQRIVQHLGVACDERQLEELWALGTRLIPELQARAREEKALREGQGLLFESSPEDYERPVPQDVRVRVKSLRNVEHVLEGPFEVWGDVFSKLGLEGIFGTGNRDLGSTNLLKLCLTAKLYDGGSKRRAVQWINETLGLDLGKDRFYRMMDRLAARIDQVKERGFVCGRHLAAGDVSLLLFDVTTLYFESFEEDPDDPPSEASSSSSEGYREQAAAAGTHRSSGGQPEDDEGGFPQDPGLPGRGLRRNGYSKDNKVNETQVVLALATSAEGIPLWYDLFPGNMPEGKTLLESLAGVGKRLDPKETWLVADGAMLQTANRTALEKNGYRYVLGSSLRKLPATERAEALDRSGYAPLRGSLPRAPFEEDEEGTGEEVLGSEDRTWRLIRRANGNTLLVTWSASKARRDAHKRERLRLRLEKQLDGRGQIRGKELISNRGTAKFVEPVGEEGCYRLRLEKLEEEARYDGLHGVETNMPVASEAEALRVLAAYGQLWHIEDCFRVAKNDLKLRPVFHWTKSRIQAHVAICFLALLMERYLEKRLEVKRHLTLSPRGIRTALGSAQSSLVRDTDTGTLYRMPLPLSGPIREIYRALGLQRRVETTEITSLAKYRHRIPKCPAYTWESRHVPDAQTLLQETEED